VYGNVLKNDTYPLSVSAERIVQAKSIAEYALSIGAQAVAHGSTGAGNDQVRFDMIFQILAPEIEIITPIRDLKLSRQEEIDYLKTHGVSMNFEKAAYSVNKGIWGTSVGGKETLTSSDYLPESAWPTPVTEHEPKEVKLTFVQGQIKAIDGEFYSSSVDAILKLQSLAAPFGIGRVGFEAAAPVILIKAHQLIEKHTLTKWQLYWKKQLAEFYGNHLHEGHFLDPVMRNFETFLESTQEQVSGEVRVLLQPYRFTLLGITSVHDLMSAKFGSYGEMNKGYTGEDVKGFTRILGNQTAIFHKVKNAND
jgi:argininosuccinate synthase